MKLEAALQQIWDMLVALFIAPGDAMMHSLAATPWGQEWGISANEWTINMGVALLFWCVVFSLIGAMNDQIQRVMNRNRMRRRTD